MLAPQGNVSKQFDIFHLRAGDATVKLFLDTNMEEILAVMNST